MRVVLDTNVVVSALLWEGTPRVLFHSLTARKALFSSKYLLDELESTLGKKKLGRRLLAAGRTRSQFLDAYAASCRLVTPVAVSLSINDVKDLPVLGTAIAANASLLVSGDRHLRDLLSFGSIRIVSPATALAELHS